MLLTLKPSELKPGMFVVSYGAGTFDDPLVAVERLILSRDVARYVPAEAGVVQVDPERSVDVAELAPEERQVPQPLTALRDELPVAARLYGRTVALVRTIMEAVRAGRPLDLFQAAPLMEEMAESLARNETAAVTVRLRRLDDYTFAHCANVAVLAMLLGRFLGFPEEDLPQLGLAGLLHDLGKARIPESILNKPGKLSEAEMEVMRRHPLEGYLVLKDRADVAPEVARAVLEHHERTDGAGYPYHLAGQDISLFSQIIGVVDVYDALISDTVYRHAVPPAAALSQLYNLRSKGFCTECVDMLVKALGIYPVGSFVRLSSGDYGVVAEGNPKEPLHPKVRLVFDARMRPKRAVILDLARRGPDPDQGLSVQECLNPAQYKIDVSRFLL